MFSFNVTFITVNFIIYFLIICFGRLNKNFKNAQVQNIHEFKTLRLGGQFVFISLLIFSLLFYKESELTYFLIFLMPVMIIFFVEDFIHTIDEKIRLLILFIYSFFFICEINLFPFLNFSLIDSYEFIKLVFFILCVIVFINGMNLIDGCNGNLILTTITQVFVIYLLASNYLYFEYFNQIKIFLLFLLLLLFFNNPLGKIFSGDSGAYFFGYFNAYILLKLFGTTTNLHPALAVLIFIYPAYEVLFSFVRKYNFDKINPLAPDQQHLHHLIYKLICLKVKSKLFANNLTILFLLPFILFPFVAIIKLSIIKIYFLLALFIVLYNSLYIFIRLKLPREN